MVSVCGPDLDAPELKRLIRESIRRTGEDDPTGERLVYNKKKGK
eukprot:CAMPEP_0206023998 /NCGR_PEP_ID=MMETSP1464-20131121/37444_1 /ASSEMBLY_ACC=CAM_ASM_001124 /TAXON_ID=119497 /ORGANISM="Exanthemachrysis gayraliae, Strain RCC1523" /LENGTH=43 /DNA_ID= /DNA_START= /DNA_END= /DNA_ORIENTATION=